MTSAPTRVLTPASLTTADATLLYAILRYHCLTALQATKLLYARSSLTWIQSKLKKLAEAGYLTRDRIPTRPTQGTAPLYYALSRKGLAYLTSLGVPVPGAIRPYQVHEYSYLFLAHLLAVNEVLIAAELLCKAHPSIRLARLQHDQELKRQPVYVAGDGGKRQAVVPDGFLDFEVHTMPGYRVPLCLELDRGTERQRDIRAKIRALVAFSRGPYQAAFGRRSLTICFIASSGPDRLRALIAWTREELTALNVTDAAADIFRFAAFPLDWHIPEAERPSPAELFLAPRWQRAFGNQTEPVPLFRAI